MEKEPAPGMGQGEKRTASREMMFCYFLARLGDPREAAVQAGYSARGAGRQAARLLERETVRRELVRQEAMVRECQTADRALLGLCRLAFGPVNDAVALVLQEEIGPQEVGELDLFSVAEVKRTRGGGLEIRFFDRLKAMELLLSHTDARDSKGASTLLEALQKGADSLKKRKGA